jgi:hypothetical protein
MVEARCPLSFSTLTEPSGKRKLLLSDKGILITGGCSANGEAEARRGIAKIVANEKCILTKRVEELVTVELLVGNGEALKM